MSMKLVKSLSFLFLVLACVFFVIIFVFNDLFGDMEFPLQQILLNIFTGFEGVDTGLHDKGLHYVLLCFCCMGIIYTLIFLPKLFLYIFCGLFERIKKTIRNFIDGYFAYSGFYSSKYFYSILIISTILFLYSLFLIEKKFHIYEYAKNYFIDIEVSEDFIGNNYFVQNSNDIYFNKKNNIIFVLAESYEDTFVNFSDTISYAPNMKLFQENSQSIKKLFEYEGLNWTIAAITGWSFGLPLKLPSGVRKNHYKSQNGFLPGAESIFDVLKAQGYHLVVVMGADVNYSGKNYLFSTHGNFTIYDKTYFLNQEYDLEDHQGTGWGFSDKFILERAHEIYLTLKEQKEPFLLFIETLDTHMPNGYCPEDLKRYGDIRDAYLNADKYLGKFLKLIQKDAKHDAIAVVGDHNFMGSPKFIPKDKTRTIYNAFWGNIPKIPASKKNARASALDLAPTILEMAGATLENGRFGLGVSLFSEHQSLAEKLSLEDLNHNLALPSKKYNQFY